jgi:hypothetical protein
MGVGESLICLWVPIWVDLSNIFKGTANPYILVPHLKGVLESVSEDIDRPIIGASFIAVDDMN